MDGEEALEGVRRQWALNKDASDGTNSAIAEGAAVVAKSYAGIDFIELVQETNELAAALFISNEEALALTNALLKAGFPPEQLDTLSEYGQQMADAGFSAKEIQAIFEAGIDTKTWNIDNLNDGVKEARINMASFGDEVPKALAELLKGTDVSKSKMQEWGKAVADGGKEGSKAMSEMVTWLDGIEDSSLRNAIATEIFKTKWEDQGANMLAVFNGVDGAIDKTTQNQNLLQGAIDKTNADPLVKISEAGNKIQEALKPVLEIIANLISKIAEWVSNNAGLTAAIVAIVATLGILTGAFAALMPAVGGLVTAWPILASAIGAITGPIGIAVLAITGLGAAFVALWQNSETFRDGVTTVFESIKSVAVTVFETVASFIGEKIAQIKQFWDQNGAQILQAAENVFNGIKAVIEFCMPAVQFIIETVWMAIQNIIDGALKVIMGAIQVFSGLFTGDFSKMWEGIKSIFSGAIELIVGWMTLSFFGGLKTILTNLAKTGVNLLKGMWDNIAGFFTSMGSKVSSTTSSFVSSVINFFKNLATNAINSVKSLWNNSVSFFTNLANSAKSIVSEMVSSVLNFVKNLATNFVNSVSTMKTNVVNKMAEIKDGMIDKIKSLPSQFLQIGKDIINGLIKGIGDMFGGVQKKIEGLAALIPEWAKDILGIHSPSRVMAEVGMWTGEGLAQGIESTYDRNEGAMKELGQLLIDATKDNQAAVTEIANKAEKERTAIQQDAATKKKEIEKKLASDIHAIESKASAKKKKLTKEENNRIAKLREEANAKLLKLDQENQKKFGSINSKAWSDMVKKEESASSERLKVIKQYIADKDSSNELSLATEAHILEESLKLFKDGTAEKIEIQKMYQKVTGEINKESESINKTYVDNVKKLNADYIAQEQKLTKEYEDTLSKRRDALYSFSGLFDEVVKKDVSGSALITALQSQITAFEDWQKNITELASKGIDDGLLAELRDMGPKAGAEIAALNSLTDTQLQQYVELWKTKNALARTQAEAELTGLKQNTEKQINELRTKTAEQLRIYQNEWRNSMISLKGNVKNEMSEMPSIGEFAVNGLIDGMMSKQGQLMSAVQSLASIVSDAFTSALDIHSPSRVMRGYGVNIGEGLILGINDMVGKVAGATRRLSNAVTEKANNSVPGNTKSSTTNRTENNTKNNYNLIVNSPKPLDPYETARLSRNGWKEMGLQL